MNGSPREGVEHLRGRVGSGHWTPSLVREALLAVPPLERDAWVDALFELDAPPDDGPELPRGCVPYLPCPVDALVRLVEHAPVRAEDVVVDVGAGVGRAAALVHLLSGARSVAVEVQPALAQAARALSQRLGLPRMSVVEGDVLERPEALTAGSVFFLYCPFSGERLERFLAALEPLARARSITVATVDLPLPPVPWLERVEPGWDDLLLFRSIGRIPVR